MLIMTLLQPLIFTVLSVKADDLEEENSIMCRTITYIALGALVSLCVSIAVHNKTTNTSKEIILELRKKSEKIQGELNKLTREFEDALKEVENIKAENSQLHKTNRMVRELVIKSTLLYASATEVI